MIIAALLAAASVAAPDWRPLDPDNTLLIDTEKGRVVIEMRPEFAPKSVERVKLLTREGVYDGLQFHRVIPGFVAQTGNPNNKDGGTSNHPDLPAEFQFRLPPQTPVAAAAQASDAWSGFLGATPLQAVPPKPGQPLRGWGAYCTGVAGMGRQADPNTGNSEIFFMLDATRRLDRDYTVWGRVVSGMDAVKALAAGEPPAKPDHMLKVRVAADMPVAERPKLSVLNEQGAAFKVLVAKVRAAKGADFSVCDVEIPVRTD
ncbi:peptidylprolyl isomerase [Caulobacter segnis]|uniref:peptidylprolyl isomerase n=1 Tax=Caulobacter segnis TaxID=88688 RepID=UPI00240ED0DB|nr:peptidylprolyl isomerase [Caulobacter segnis]MDG2519991.1 peptidylprolyl isomerase [Caulobacter segnis]